MTDGQRHDEFSGEVWTDARGFATVHIPEMARLHGRARYALTPFTNGVNARLAAEMIDGRFTIATDEPHVKVAWRVHGPSTRKGEE